MTKGRRSCIKRGKVRRMQRDVILRNFVRFADGPIYITRVSDTRIPTDDEVGLISFTAQHEGKIIKGGNVAGIVGTSSWGPSYENKASLDNLPPTDWNAFLT